MVDYVSLNAEQTHSEKDPFTHYRYRQFYRHFSKRAYGCDTKTIIDIGCNTGGGGEILKK